MAKINLAKMADLLESVGLDCRTLWMYAEVLNSEQNASNFSEKYLDSAIYDLLLISNRLAGHFTVLENEYINNLRPHLQEINRLAEQQEDRK